MKRFFILFLVIVAMLPVSSALAIEFHGIPWGISVNELTTALEERGIAVSPDDISADADMPVWTYEFYDLIGGIDSTGYRISLDYWFDNEKVKIAGYPVNSFSFCAHYDIADGVLKRNAENSHYYMAQMTFDYFDIMAESVYIDLMNKLTGLYGDYTDEGITILSTIAYEYKVWADADGNAVCLYHREDSDSDFHSVALVYGQPNIEATLQTVRQLVIQSEIQAVSNDISGL